MELICCSKVWLLYCKPRPYFNTTVNYLSKLLVFMMHFVVYLCMELSVPGSSRGGGGGWQPASSTPDEDLLEDCWCMRVLYFMAYLVGPIRCYADYVGYNLRIEVDCFFVIIISKQIPYPNCFRLVTLAFPRISLKIYVVSIGRNQFAFPKFIF